MIPKLYNVLLSDGSTMQMLGTDIESAAWAAIELTRDQGLELVNIVQVKDPMWSDD